MLAAATHGKDVGSSRQRKRKKSITYGVSAQHVCFNHTVARQPMYCADEQHQQHAHICEGYTVTVSGKPLMASSGVSHFKKVTLLDKPTFDVILSNYMRKPP